MIAALYNKIRDAFEVEHSQLILWVPVALGLGITWYFSLRDEPPIWLGGALFLSAAIGVGVFRRVGWLRNILLFVAMLAFGVALAQWRVHHIHSPALVAPMNYAEVTGKVVDIEPTPKGSKILLTNVTIAKLLPEETPKNISLTLRTYDPNLQSGQIMSLHAGLFPPPEPALPGGFDFGRYFFFHETGAVGYGIAPITTRSLENSGEGSFDIWFAGFRHRLTESIRSYFPEPEGAVAAAFITGEVRAIPDAINDNMRVAGLYHLLAVSGMNLSVVAGLAFFSLRLLLATIPPLALRYPIKKWAAILALIASYIYLRVSGSPVSAERAFFMVSLIFIAILLDREPAPMRSVAIAAFCILLYEPEALLTASFQLSFSATAALIASYEYLRNWFARYPAEGFGLHRVWLYFAAVIATSTVAWLGTEPFIIYHFNQFSSYGLVANTIAEPLVSFILMPLVIAGVLLMPFGLAKFAFVPLKYGIECLLWLADHVARLPHAMWLVPSPTGYGFLAVILGLVWVYFWQQRWRWLGVIPIIAGMMTSFYYIPPDVFIGGDGKHIAVRLDDGRMVMLRGRTGNMTSQQWAHTVMERDFAEKNDTPVQCDKMGCVVAARGHTIAALANPEAAFDDCALADTVIVISPIARSMCGAATMVDKTQIDADGAITLWFDKDHTLLRAVHREMGHRPWTPSAYEGDD